MFKGVRNENGRPVGSKNKSTILVKNTIASILDDNIELFKEKLQLRAGTQKWWELQQPQEAYRNFIESKKIIYVDMANESTFSLDVDGSFIFMRMISYIF